MSERHRAGGWGGGRAGQKTGVNLNGSLGKHRKTQALVSMHLFFFNEIKNLK